MTTLSSYREFGIEYEPFNHMLRWPLRPLSGSWELLSFPLSLLLVGQLLPDRHELLRGAAQVVLDLLDAVLGHLSPLLGPLQLRL